ncbi:guanylate kinase [Bergeyella zoohelcum CCUG 30536]|uniref:Guanylate kinase n=2 Tax=Bergeyella zoohelcum TaxID=1015 RepID=A0A376C0P6_9FLAO|nr:guanylate kinase [Bergeyella zoohelcum CCUG 30536]SSZ55589.1 Guanylate kinase [Bergeyella zoohelcum]
MCYDFLIVPITSIFLIIIINKTMKKVIIFSAPSGSGKTTLVQHCLQVFPVLQFSISCTTRAPRGAEVDGKDYHFISPEVFKAKIEEDAFVEYEEVYADKFYGTLKSEVERIWNQDKIVIFDVDVKGGIALKKYFGDQAMSVFIMPPSIEELEKRLKNRGTDDIETIKTRLAKAESEILFQKNFDKIIVNANLDESKEEIENLIRQFIA